MVGLTLSAIDREIRAIVAPEDSTAQLERHAQTYLSVGVIKTVREVSTREVAA